MTKDTFRTLFSRAPVRLALVAALSVAALTQGCANRSQLSSDGLHDKLDFPTADTSTWTGNGSFPLVEALRKLRPGMTKDQVSALIGRPHYQEGFFAVREWDYRLNVTNEAGAPQFDCQLKVLFNSHSEARNYYRKCGDNVETLIDGKWRKYQAPVEVTVPVASASHTSSAGATPTAVTGSHVASKPIK